MVLFRLYRFAAILTFSAACLCFSSCSDRSELYASAKEMHDEGDFVLQEIKKHNPECRQLCSISQHDYRKIGIMHERIYRPISDAVAQREKMSHFVLLMMPGDFVVKLDSCFKPEEASGEELDFLNEFSSCLDISKLSFSRLEIRKIDRYRCSTSSYSYHLIVYRMDSYSLVLADISRDGKYVPDEEDPHDEYKWKWVPDEP